jgi:predicted 3-demethylubiquinone-9 3-methyltransferase (glyoxalase superfamily)
VLGRRKECVVHARLRRQSRFNAVLPAKPAFLTVQQAHDRNGLGREQHDVIQMVQRIRIDGSRVPYLDGRSHMAQPAKNTICLWYDRDAEDAARFYARTFPDSSVAAVHRAPGDFPSGKKGDVLTVDFTVVGIPCLGLNGGPAFKHNEAFSFQIATADQAETDRYWNAIVGNGGQESACGWCKDKWGLSWQITPIALTNAITNPDPAAAKRAFDAMMQMQKIDIATIEAAVRG